MLSKFLVRHLLKLSQIGGLFLGKICGFSDDRFGFIIAAATRIGNGLSFHPTIDRWWARPVVAFVAVYRMRQGILVLEVKDESLLVPSVPHRPVVGDTESAFVAVDRMRRGILFVEY